MADTKYQTKGDGCLIFFCMCILIAFMAFLIGSQVKDLQRRVGQLEQQCKCSSHIDRSKVDNQWQQ